MNCYFVTFGCKVNTCETAGMEAILKKAGHHVTRDPAQADVMVFNSCTVTASGDSRLRIAMRKMKKRYPAARFVLTGCYAQAYPQQAACIPEADLIIGTKNRSRLPALLEELCHDSVQRNAVDAYTTKETFELLPCDTVSGHTRAFLKIQDGCNCFCKYCIIPYARGRMRSLPPEELQKSAARFAKNGYQEIVLCGINLGFYGVQWESSLAEAVEICAQTKGIRRVRLSSLEPERMDNETLDRLAALSAFCPQFHLSLQSGCDRTLIRMGRRYTTEDYRTLCRQIREKFPDCAITTDFMVGFPGETEADFAQALRFVQEIGFASMHVFRYSPRPGTKAAEMAEQIEDSVKTRRMEVALRTAQDAKAAFLKAQIGKTVSVLFERERGDGYHVGHAPNGTVVRVLEKNSEKSLRNQLFYVRIEESDADCCYGILMAADVNSDKKE